MLGVIRISPVLREAGLLFVNCCILVVLQMYIGDKLIDKTILSFRAMNDLNLREAHVQGAITEMLEK
jgi:hypothetical protein